MKTSFFQLVFISLIITNVSLAQNFYRVPERTNTYVDFNKEIIKYDVDEFAISDLIIVAEFNEYLNSVQKDSSQSFYAAQLPKSHHFSSELLSKILNSKELQNEPMPGVSWNVAKNYCRWFAEKAVEGGEQYEYTLPSIGQIEAFTQHFKIEEPFILQNWTSNPYDESFHISNILTGVDYFELVPQADDPPVFKRIWIYGGSSHMDFINDDTYPRGIYEYKDSSSRYIGFRMVRTENLDELKASKRFSGKHVAKNEANPIKTIEISFPTDQKMISHMVNGLQVETTVLNNQFHGPYIEKYSNGKTRIDGSFQNGRREGVWTVKDSFGQVLLQRNYSGKNFETVYPKPRNPFKEVFEEFPIETLVRDEFGVRKYVYVEEHMVSASMRLWRTLNSKNEVDLFKMIHFPSLVEDFVKENIDWYYYGISADFKEKIEGKDLEKLINEISNWDYSRIEIKEDFFFNSSLLKGDARQIAMSFYANDTEEAPSFTVYFPRIRKVLMDYPMSVSSNKEITNLDDYFYFNAYRGMLTKHSSIKPVTKTDLEIEFSRLLLEHDQWIKFGR